MNNFEDDIQQDHTQHSSNVGELLREKRLEYGLELEQVAEQIHIRDAYLDALERGDMSTLPGRVYAIGFVRTYAEYLGLDGNEVVEAFKKQKAGEKQSRPELSMPPVQNDNQLPGKRVLVGCIIVIALFGIGGLVLSQTSTGERTEIPAVPEKLTQSSLVPKLTPVQEDSGSQQAGPENSEGENGNTTQTPYETPDLFGKDVFADMRDRAMETIRETTTMQPAAQQESIQAEDTNPSRQAVQIPPTQAASSLAQTAPTRPEARPEPETTASRAVLVVTEDSWVEVTDAQGQVIVSEVFKPGTRYRIPNREGLVMTTGNAGGLILSIDGNNVGRLGRAAEVKRNISLDRLAAAQTAPASR